jgi:transketolase
VAAGITVFEALKAHQILAGSGTDVTIVDAFSLQPIDARTIASCARNTAGRVLTVEDHYFHGGLGDCVARALAPHGIVVQRLAVDGIPRSGTPEQLLDRFRISAKHIVAGVERLAVEPPDQVEQSSIESFPASDPPSWIQSHL